MGDIFREHKEELKELKAKQGIDCPSCRARQSKCKPTRLLPGWECNVCGYLRPSLAIITHSRPQARSITFWNEKRVGVLLAQLAQDEISLADAGALIQVEIDQIKDAWYKEGGMC